MNPKMFMDSQRHLDLSAILRGQFRIYLNNSLFFAGDQPANRFWDAPLLEKHMLVYCFQQRQQSSSSGRTPLASWEIAVPRFFGMMISWLLQPRFAAFIISCLIRLVLHFAEEMTRDLAGEIASLYPFGYLWRLDIYIIIYICIWLLVWNMFPIYWE